MTDQAVYIAQLEAALIKSTEHNQELFQLLRTSLEEFGRIRSVLDTLNARQLDILTVLASDERAPVWDFRQSSILS